MGRCLFPTSHASFQYAKPECAKSSHGSYKAMYKIYRTTHRPCLATRENMRTRFGSAAASSTRHLPIQNGSRKKWIAVWRHVSRSASPQVPPASRRSLSTRASPNPTPSPRCHRTGSNANTASNSTKRF